MAGDRGASDDGTILALDAPKVWKIGPYLIGYAGSMDGERIRYNFKPSAPILKDIDKHMQTKFIKELKEELARRDEFNATKNLNQNQSEYNEDYI